MRKTDADLMNALNRMDIAERELKEARALLDEHQQSIAASEREYDDAQRQYERMAKKFREAK